MKHRDHPCRLLNEANARLYLLDRTVLVLCRVDDGCERF